MKVEKSTAGDWGGIAFRIAMAVACFFLVVFGSLFVFGGRSKTLSAPIVEVGIAPRLAQGPIGYSWAEVMAGEPTEHRGGVVFYRHKNRVYSRAWFTHARNSRPWPPVEGVGTLSGNEIQMAYRSASGDAKHDYYHAECRFVFDPDGKSFRCSFTQKATPKPDDPVSPGNAAGALVPASTDEYRQHVKWVKDLPDRPVERGPGPTKQAPPCPVLPHMQSRSDVKALYNGREYRFCCSSCRAVFLRRPDAFVERSPRKVREGE